MKQVLRLELDDDIIASFSKLGIDINQFLKIKALEFLNGKSAAEVAEQDKGAGLKILFRRDTRVRIPPSA
jgi:hypothetical protein